MYSIKNEIIEKAKIALNDKDLKRFLRHLELDSMSGVLYYSEEYLVEATSEALKSIYNGDCDMAVFHNYKICKDLFNSVKEYENEEYK